MTQFKSALDFKPPTHTPPERPISFHYNSSYVQVPTPRNVNVLIVPVIYSRPPYSKALRPVRPRRDDTPQPTKRGAAHRQEEHTANNEDRTANNEERATSLHLEPPQPADDLRPCAAEPHPLPYPPTTPRPHFGSSLTRRPRAQQTRTCEREIARSMCCVWWWTGARRWRASAVRTARAPTRPRARRYSCRSCGNMGEGVREFTRSALENAVAEYAGGAPLLQADGAGDGVRVAQEGERGGERGGGALRTQYGGAARGAQAGRLLRRRKARARGTCRPPSRGWAVRRRSERMWSCCGMRDELRRGFDLTCEESAQQKSSLTAIGSCIWAFQLLSDEGEDKNGIG
ncbi:hypothetical protein C8J57DRAFT_1633152 [Mycena rebaudengoi]|nr:hypothetical protein C8J57DRAFT_1633152 [Mycena rebaudengoi]